MQLPARAASEPSLRTLSAVVLDSPEPLRIAAVGLARRPAEGLP